MEVNKKTADLKNFGCSDLVKKSFGISAITKCLGYTGNGFIFYPS